MIIPKRDAKCYGAVHIDNYLTFTGFCKKVDSDEICDLDVFVDGKKIDTLKADKKIGKVEDIYDIEGHGFEFELTDEYFEKSHSLEFKASTGEELVNSKIQTIDKKHPKFNEYRFLNGLIKIKKETLKDKHGLNTISFIINNVTLKDKKFLQYLEDLQNRFEDVNFVAFYFQNTDKEFFIKNYKLSNKLNFITPCSIEDLTTKIKIFIHHGEDKVMEKAFLIISQFTENIFTINFNSSIKDLLLKNYDRDLMIQYKNFFDNPQRFGISEEFVSKYDKKITLITINAVLKQHFGLDNTTIDLEKSVYQNRYINEIEYVLKFDDYTKYKKKLDYMIYLDDSK